ncbi:MAG: hypothetical protein IPK12_08135 [Gemmatimonadetes bacterium]|nr:hypothetical protein [Gemmatimonadota bacterium]
MGDDYLLFASPRELAARFEVSKDDPKLAEGCALLARLRNRDLPKRAFAFARRFIPPPPPNYMVLESVGQPDRLNWGNADYEAVNDILDTEEGKAIFIADVEALLSELNVSPMVLMGVQSPRRAAGTMNIPVLTRDGGIERNPPWLFEGSKWSNAYALNKQTSFVFADGDLEQVHLATERAFTKRNLSFPPSSWMLAKFTREALAPFRAALPKTEEWLPHHLEPDYLETGAARQRVEALQRKFASLLNTIDKDIGPSLVPTWLWQLLDSDLQESALCLLEYFSFFEQREIIDGFHSLVEQERVRKDYIWVPLRPIKGEAGSADQLTYDLGELAVDLRALPSLTARDIEEAKGIVFFDDTLNTGTQAACLISSWFGATHRCNHPPDNDAVGALPTHIQEALRKVPVVYALHSAHPIGKATVTALAQDLGLTNFTVASALNLEDPRFTLAGFLADDTVRRERLVAKLQKKGELMLKRKHSEWETRLCEERALGYGGMKLTVAYRHSIGSGIPIALTAFSDDPTDVWLPVLPRKPSSVVQAIRNAHRSPRQLAAQ